MISNTTVDFTNKTKTLAYLARDRDRACLQWNGAEVMGEGQIGNAEIYHVLKYTILSSASSANSS